MAEKERNRPGGEKLPLSQAMQYLLEECRMVLPGIQALFGFQLIVVFHDTFPSRLDRAEQMAHLVAIGLVATAVALVMTPAAYHRQTAPDRATEHFVRLCSRLLLWSMFPLALGICLDFYLIARIITQSPAWSAALALALLGLFFGLWLVLPWRRRERARESL